MCFVVFFLRCVLDPIALSLAVHVKRIKLGFVTSQRELQISCDPANLPLQKKKNRMKGAVLKKLSVSSSMVQAWQFSPSEVHYQIIDVLRTARFSSGCDALIRYRHTIVIIS